MMVVSSEGEALNSNTMRNTAAELTEATVVELNDGTLKMFMRNRSGHVQFSTSKDGGATWGAVETISDIPDVYVQTFSSSHCAKWWEYMYQ